MRRYTYNLLELIGGEGVGGLAKVKLCLAML